MLQDKDDDKENEQSRYYAVPSCAVFAVIVPFHLYLFSHHQILIPVPVIRTAFEIALDHPGIIILIHLAVTDVFFIVLVIDKICACAAQTVHHPTS